MANDWITVTETCPYTGKKITAVRLRSKLPNSGKSLNGLLNLFLPKFKIKERSNIKHDTNSDSRQKMGAAEGSNDFSKPVRITMAIVGVVLLGYAAYFGEWVPVDATAKWNFVAGVITLAVGIAPRWSMAIPSMIVIIFSLAFGPGLLVAGANLWVNGYTVFGAIVFLSGIAGSFYCIPLLITGIGSVNGNKALEKWGVDTVEAMAKAQEENEKKRRIEKSRKLQDAANRAVLAEFNNR